MNFCKATIMVISHADIYREMNIKYIGGGGLGQLVATLVGSTKLLYAGPG